MVATDPYGTDLLLTDDGDFSVTPSGQLALLSGPLNCAQALTMRLKTAPGELALQPVLRQRDRQGRHRHQEPATRRCS
jgi:hypothetical protein